MSQWPHAIWAAFTSLMASLRQRPRQASFSDDSLIEDFSIVVSFRCPCGSSVLHVVNFIHETVDCRRCGRQLAIREMSYLRAHPRDQPRVKFSIGYVVTPARLRAMPTDERVQ